MNQPNSETGLFTPIRIMLVDLDPIFRLGLKTCLDQSPDFEVVADFGRASEILPRIEKICQGRDSSSLPIDLVVWSLDVRQAGQPSNVGIPQLVRLNHPSLPLMVLLGQLDTLLLEALRQDSVQGCWLKDANEAALLAAMRQIASGQTVWDARLLKALSMVSQSSGEKVARHLRGVQSGFSKVRQFLGVQGLQEIESGLMQLDQLLAGPGLGIWERVVLEGRFRELRAARWVVQSLMLAEPQGRSSRNVEVEGWSTSHQEKVAASAVELGVPQKWSDESGQLTAPVAAVREVVMSENQFHAVKKGLMSAIVAKIPISLNNLTAEPLELDILNPEKRQELLFIVVRGIEELLDDLRCAELPRSQLTQTRSRMMLELWQQATVDFFGKYTKMPRDTAVFRSTTDASLLTREVEIVSVLLQDASVVERAILDKIPFVDDVLEHLLYQVPLQVDNQWVGFGSPGAMRQAEAILENWVVRMANAVIAPLLNAFGSSEFIKQNFYDRRWMSTREIERFRNSLSWKYRMQQLFREPKQIFESQIPMLIFREFGIRCQALYTPRDRELQQLQGIPLAVTLALEARDAIAPPLRATFTWMGRGVVYVLTQVLGRGIGLIGRGILQGVGTAWQETRGERRTPQQEKDVR